MKRQLAVLLAALCCGGCFESETPLYQGVKPLEPFHAGKATARDKDGKQSHMMLAVDAGGVYRLTGSDPGKDFGKGFRLRFFALPGSALLAAEAKSCEGDFKACASGSGWMYELVRVTQTGAEWRDPDCSKTLSQLSGIAVKVDNCTFADHASLEKALRAAAGMPWQADGSYTLD